MESPSSPRIIAKLEIARKILFPYIIYMLDAREKGDNDIISYVSVFWLKNNV